MIKPAILLAAVLSLGACATASNVPPQSIAGRADTARFKVFLGIGATDSAADQRAADDFEAFRLRNGFATFSVLERRFEDRPTRIEYVVRFVR
jgi:hypothetical protein